MDRKMSYQEYKARARERREEARARIHQAMMEFSDAVNLADSYGLILERVPTRHQNQYRIRHRGYGWTIDIFPGRQSIVRPAKLPVAPYLDIRRNPWTLSDIVEAAIAADDDSDQRKRT